MILKKKSGPASQIGFQEAFASVELMLNIEELGEEYELLWPAEIFSSEVNAAIKSGPNFRGFAEKLLKEAFAEAAPSGRFHLLLTGSEWGTPGSTFKPTETGARQFLSDLASCAHLLPVGKTVAPYWTQKGCPQSPTPKQSMDTLRVAWVGLVEELIEAGFYAQAVGQNCVDNERYLDIEANLSKQIELRTGVKNLWPIAGAFVLDDMLLTLIEVLHDLAARPRSSSPHNFNECGVHYDDFARRPGQAIYRWRVNELLASHGSDLRLSDEGEDRGRLVTHFSDPRANLVTQISEPEGTTDRAEIEHAIALFRKRGATREDKRSACNALARVLEMRRPLLEAAMKKEAVSQNENQLFFIANGFDIRHNRLDQRPDYDVIFLDWIFWLSLASCDLTSRLMEREGISPQLE